MSAVPAPQPVTLEDRVMALELGHAQLVADIHSLRGTVDKIEEKVGNLNDKLAARPSWAVCTVIAGLGSIATALGATLLTLLVQTS